MASFRSYASAYHLGGSSTSITINKPSGVVDNDVLIAVLGLYPDNNVTWTPPSGWTQRDSFEDTCEFAIFTKTASSEGSSYEFDWDVAASDVRGIILAYSGIDISGGDDGFDVVGSTDGSGTDKFWTCPTVTTTLDGDLVLRIMAVRPNQSTSSGWIGLMTSGNPPATTMRYYASDELFIQIIISEEDTRPDAGATGTAIFTLPANQTNVATLTLGMFSTAPIFKKVARHPMG